MTYKKFQYHVAKCRLTQPPSVLEKITPCTFNSTHVVHNHYLDKHEDLCPDRPPNYTKETTIVDYGFGPVKAGLTSDTSIVPGEKKITHEQFEWKCKPQPQSYWD